MMTMLQHNCYGISSRRVITRSCYTCILQNMRLFKAEKVPGFEQPNLLQVQLSTVPVATMGNCIARKARNVCSDCITEASTTESPESPIASYPKSATSEISTYITEDEGIPSSFTGFIDDDYCGNSLYLDVTGVLSFKSKSHKSSSASEQYFVNTALLHHIPALVYDISIGSSNKQNSFLAPSNQLSRSFPGVMKKKRLSFKHVHEGINSICLVPGMSLTLV